MAQFDVYLNPTKNNRKHYPYILDIQSNHLSDLATRIVIPLGNASSFRNESLKGLTPEVSFEDHELLILTPQISTMLSATLSEPIGTLEHFRTEILNAIDFAISGY